MKLLKMSFLRGVLKNEQGQSIMLLAIGWTAFIGVAGISMDLGHAYVARQQLQASTNAAALSGAVYLSSAYLNKDSAKAAVIKYSSTTGNLNAASSLTNVQMQDPSFVCLATVTASMGIPCLGSGTSFNAMIVTQTADVNTWFAGIFGVSVFHLSATAYATPGGAPAPLNMAIIVDTTGSMGNTDSNCGNSTQLVCAMNGVAIMLNSLPFPTDAPVALFTFPNIQANNAANDLTSTNTITQVAYTTPALNATSYTPGTGTSATYRIVDFTTDYTNLHSAVGYVNSSGTTTTAGHLKTPTTYNPNVHTFLAGAIAAAQAALVAQNVVHPVGLGQNVIVILTDGDVNASDQYKNVDTSMTEMASTFSVTATAPNYIPTLPSDIPITTTGTHVSYPSGVGGCGQAVEAAEAARASSLQTSIFVVAYGALTTGSWNPAGKTINSTNMDDIISGTGNSSHCPADQDGFFTDFKTTGGHGGTLPTKIHNVTYTNLSYKPNISPCTTAQQIASPNTSTVTYFFSDTMAGTAGTCSSTSTLTTLKDIFKAIVGELPHVPRLVPNGTT
jgi:Flp pilus assembly protein TadG